MARMVASQHILGRPDWAAGDPHGIRGDTAIWQRTVPSRRPAGQHGGGCRGNQHSTLRRILLKTPSILRSPSCTSCANHLNHSPTEVSACMSCTSSMTPQHHADRHPRLPALQGRRGRHRRLRGEASSAPRTTRNSPGHLRRSSAKAPVTSGHHSPQLRNASEVANLTFP
jgi:hypothetical protein